MSNNIKVAASIMCGNQLDLRNELRRLEAAKVDYLHCDVMDGMYVSNLAMGPYVLQQIRDNTSISLDIHMAVVEPERYVDVFADIKPEIISVHPESTKHFHRVIHMIKERGIKASAALNPSTPLSAIKHVLKDLDMVLVMTVDPGFAGQKFFYGALKKLRDLKQMCLEAGIDPMIQVDGNINSTTIPLTVKEGANVLVAGTSSIFKGDDADYAALVKEMLSTCGQ